MAAKKSSRVSRNSARKSSSSTPAPRTAAEVPAIDAIALLKRDHREVDALFKEFQDATGRSKASIALRICEALSVHAQIEEEIFYPAARAVLDRDDEDLVDEAAVEHSSLKELIAQIQDGKPSDDLFDAKVKVLGEYTRHHVREEETDLFPKVRSAGLDADVVGAKLAARKTQLTGKPVPPDDSLKGRIAKLVHRRA